MIEQDKFLQRDYNKVEEGLDPVFMENYNLMVDDLNQRMKSFPFKYLNGQILDVVIPATSELRISHFLAVTPKYRLILGQTGDGVITDRKGKDSSGFLGWNNKYVTLYNNGAVEVTLTIMLIKE